MFYVAKLSSGFVPQGEHAEQADAEDEARRLAASGEDAAVVDTECGDIVAQYWAE